MNDSDYITLDKHNPYSQQTYSVIDPESNSNYIRIYLNELSVFINNDNYLLACELQNHARFIKIICSIDILCTILNASIELPYVAFISSIGLCGFFGAQYYNKNLTLTYMIYQNLKIITKSIFILFIINPTFILFSIFSICLDIYIFTKVKYFYYLLPKININ